MLMGVLVALLLITLLWAFVVTLMLLKNPLPFPDKGHRIFGVPDEDAREVVVKLLSEVSHLRERFTFDSGEVHQTLMWDGFTSIHYLDPEIQRTRKINGNGLSIPVDDPVSSAQKAIEFLRAAGYKASLIENINFDLPPNHLVPVESDAFNGWALVFRRPMFKMPFPKLRKK